MTRRSVPGRTGLWLIGARGSVATTAIAGLLALRAGLIRPYGCVTEHLDVDPALLPAWDEIVVGGHDIVDTSLEKRAERLADGGVLPARVLSGVRDGLRTVEASVRPGYHPSTHTGSLADAVRRIVADLEQFRDDNDLARVVVVNVSSTEPPVPPLDEHTDLHALSQAMRDPSRTVLPPTAVTAYAAFSAGCPYVEFTPSPSIGLPALTELAYRNELPYAGCDGKTGETLLRTVLAPMFTARALRVRSWAGTNLLGGGDGANLGDPVRARGKLESKARGLEALLGNEVEAPLHIDNVPDLDERKIAWDHVSFEGFLGTRMSLQFTWNGYDSALAAPLVLDLTRLVAVAHACREKGALGGLACFFKDPVGTDEHRFAEQVRMLADWVARLNRSARRSET